MSRYLKIAVACAAMLAVALPAFALESKINGYFWVQGISGNGYDGVAAGSSAINGVDNRLRVKWTANVNDNAGFVYYGEVDTPWGLQSKGADGGGGMVGADGVNIETKNSYMFFNAGGYTVQAGIQGLSGGCDYAFLLQDAAALTVAKKFGNIGTKLIWSKFSEQSPATPAASKNSFKAEGANDDDLDLYGVMVSPMLGGAKLDIGAFWISNQKIDADQYTISGELNTKMGGMDLKAWAIYQFGDQLTGTTFAGRSGHDALAASVKVSGGFGAVRGLMYSDSGTGVSFEDQSDVYEMPDTGLMIFMTDKWHNNGGQGALALKDAAYKGNGLLALMYNGKQDMGDYYVGYAAGYFTALDDMGTEGKDLGLEVAAQVGTKLAEKVDLSLRGSYAMLGSYYDATTPGASDPDDSYKVVAMLAMGF